MQTLTKVVMAAAIPTADRLDPDQDTTQEVHVDFPTEALKGKKPKEIRLGIEYLPTAYRKDTASFNVTINSQ